MAMSNNKILKFGISHIAATAVIALLLGIAYYWFTRPQSSVAFLAFLPVLPLNQYLSFFTQWLGWLPSFLHVFSFSLLTYLAFGRRHLLFSSILWGAINSLFEIGQALPLGIIQLLPDVFNLQSYFAHGVFDIFDLMACVLGALAAWVIFRNRELPNSRVQTKLMRGYVSTNSKRSNHGGECDD
jgi:glycopeptide antibiotics resistance protein